jgi:hypothetical protein
MPSFVNWLREEASDLLGSTPEEEGNTFLQNFKKNTHKMS